MTGWPEVPLAEVVEIERDGVGPAAIPTGSLYVGLENIQRDGSITDAKRVMNGELASAKFNFGSEHVLFGKLRPYLAKVACPTFEGICSTDILPLRPSDSLSRRYLYHFLRRPETVDRVSALSVGINLPRISPRTLITLPVPMPPLEEQRRIAEVLDRADALRAKRRASLAQFDALTQSIFLDMFGDERDVLKRWTTVKLGVIADFLTSGSRGWAKHYAVRGSLFLRIQNVQYDRLILDDVAFVEAPNTAEARRTRTRDGDVLLTITADLGRTAVVPQTVAGAFINQHLALIRSSAIVPRFLSAYLSSPSGQAQILRSNRQGVKAGLNFDDVKALTLPFPSLALQNRFAGLADNVDAVRRSFERAANETDALFTSLQHRAFRGEL